MCRAQDDAKIKIHKTESTRTGSGTNWALGRAVAQGRHALGGANIILDIKLTGRQQVSQIFENDPSVSSSAADRDLDVKNEN